MRKKKRGRGRERERESEREFDRVGQQTFGNLKETYSNEEVLKARDVCYIATWLSGFNKVSLEFHG